MERRLHDALSEHVLEVEQVVVQLLVRERRRRDVLGQERLGWLVVGACRGNADELALRPAEGRELAAEDAPGVDAEGVVQPRGLGHRCMAVHDGGATPIVLRPWVPHGQAVLVGLSRRLAEKGKLADDARAAPLERLLEPRVRDDELAVIEHVVTHQAVDEFRDSSTKFGRLRLELCERLGQPVGDAHVFAAQLPHQLDVVVARDREPGALGGHRHDEPQDVGHLRTSVDQVADEDRLAPRRMGRREGVLSVVVARDDVVAELFQQGLELVEAAVDVADDVERTVLGPAVVPEGLTLEGRRFDVLERREYEHVTEALPLELAKGPSELLHLLAHDVGSEGAVRPVLVPLAADLLGQVEHDGDGERVKLPRQGDERLAGLGLHVCGIDHREQSAGEPLPGDEVEQVEGIARGRLVVVVVRHEAATRIRRHDLGRLEVFAGECGFAGAGRADEHDERELGDLERLGHDPVSSGFEASAKMAIWVGAPVAGSSVPTPMKRTS
jgi:hypothetical protein